MWIISSFQVDNLTENGIVLLCKCQDLNLPLSYPASNRTEIEYIPYEFSQLYAEHAFLPSMFAEQ